MNSQRVRLLKSGKEGRGPVVYWMSRDQRSADNWALLYAQQEALVRKRPVVVVFCMTDGFLGAGFRQYVFMLKGLKELNGSLEKLAISFVLLQGNPEIEICCFVERVKAAMLVTDFDPLRIKQRWKKSIFKKITVPCYEVDAHNIVPCWVASPKQEYGAYTIRPKIHKNLSTYLEGFPVLKKHLYPFKAFQADVHYDEILEKLDVDRSVDEVDWIVPGETSARRSLKAFIRNGLKGYNDRRNDPVQDGQSGLSPYFHFGQLAPQRAALEVSQSSAPAKDKDAFLEELIIRRELSDNFCFYNPHYDSFRCVPDWAKKTLAYHAQDRREYQYSLSELEHAQTHDDLWNAAQQQMVLAGKMHGYLRMYWAKKILEWTLSVEKAWKTAVYLNDKYSLDGRDPNGYAGIAWALGGVHDRAWGERAVFGKIRYMSYNGCRSKFNVLEYSAMVFSMKEKTLYEKND